MAKRPTCSLIRGPIWLAIVVLSTAPGCSLFPGGGGNPIGLGANGLTSLQPEMPDNNSYIPVGNDAVLPSSSFNQEAYQAVRKAKQNNSIVLQILENDEPVRVLPLPVNPSVNHPAGSTHGEMESPTSGIFVSTLLKQTGVLKKYGKVQAALYRPSPSSFEGVRMDVLFADRSKDQVRPESDYALRPGDRLVIRKDDRGGLDSLLDMALGR